MSKLFIARVVVMVIVLAQQGSCWRRRRARPPPRRVPCYDNSCETDDSGLSVGAKVGIAVGICAISLFISFIVWLIKHFCCHTRIVPVVAMPVAQVVDVANVVDAVYVVGNPCH